MAAEPGYLTTRGGGLGSRIGFLMIAALTAVLSAQSQQRFSPPRLVRGNLPGMSAANVVGGGEVLIEATVDRDGRLTRPVVLRTTPPFSSMILDAVEDWRLTPAHAVGDDGTDGPVESSVLIAAVYRPPTLFNGPVLGDPPTDLATASANVVYPLKIVAPPFPSRALMGSVVLFEVMLDQTGTITEARAIGSDLGFDSAAREALLQWKFRPSRYRDRPAPATAYVIFGFSPPVAPPPVVPPLGAITIP